MAERACNETEKTKQRNYSQLYQTLKDFIPAIFRLKRTEKDSKTNQKTITNYINFARLSSYIRVSNQQEKGKILPSKIHMIITSTFSRSKYKLKILHRQFSSVFKKNHEEKKKKRIRGII